MLKNLFTLLLTLGALAAFFFSDQLAKWMAPPAKTSDKILRVARVTKARGTPLVVRQGTSSLKPKQEIYAGDRIQTDENSSVEIKVRSGHKLAIDENSEASVHLWMDKYVVYRYAGSVRLLNSSGAVDHLILADDNKAEFIEEQIGRIEEPEDRDQKSPRGLSNKQIYSGVKKFHPQLHRCYLNLIKDNRAKPGKVVINFQIENGGTVSHSQMGSTTFDDDDFHSCLLNVIKRARFPRFEGPIIVANYPINFK